MTVLLILALLLTLAGIGLLARRALADGLLAAACIWMPALHALGDLLAAIAGALADRK